MPLGEHTMPTRTENMFKSILRGQIFSAPGCMILCGTAAPSPQICYRVAVEASSHGLTDGGTAQRVEVLGQEFRCLVVSTDVMGVGVKFTGMLDLASTARQIWSDDCCSLDCLALVFRSEPTDMLLIDDMYPVC